MIAAKTSPPLAVVAPDEEKNAPFQYKLQWL